MMLQLQETLALAPDVAGAILVMMRPTFPMHFDEAENPR